MSNNLLFRVSELVSGRKVPAVLVVGALAVGSVLGDDTVTPQIEGNVYTFTVNSGTGTYTSTLTGAIQVVKEGDGVLDLGTGANTFTGGIVVNGGTLQGTYSALGGKMTSTPPHDKIVVADCATLSIVNTTGAGSTWALAKDLEVSGSGVGNLGAVRRPSGSASLHGLFVNVTLKGDTTFDATQRWGFSGGTFDMGGHDLTLRTKEYFELYNGTTTVKNPGDIYVETGKFLVQGTLTANDIGTHKFRMANGTRMDFWGSKMLWPVCGESVAIYCGNSSDTASGIDAPVTFGSGLTISENAAKNRFTIADTLDGPGTLQFNGSGTLRVQNDKVRTVGAFIVTKGTVELLDAGTFNVTNRTVGSVGYIPNAGAGNVSGTDWSNIPRLTVTGNSLFTMPRSEDKTTQAAEKHHLMIAQGTTQSEAQYGILEIGSNGVVSNDLNVARYSKTVGAIYLNGGKLYWRGGASNQGWLGHQGIGYMAINSGLFQSDGLITMGKTAGTGIVHQRGGQVKMTTSTGFSLRLARESNSYAHWHQTGGSFEGNHFACLCYADALCDQKNVEAALTVSGKDTTFALASGKAIVAYVSSNTVTSVLSVRDGATVAVQKIYKDRRNYQGDNTTAHPNFNDESFRTATANSKFYVCFDGGILKVQNKGVFFQNNFGVYDDPDRFTVYGGGLTVDTTPADGDVTWNVPVQKPSGNVLLSVSLPTDSTFVNKYIAAPRVMISGVNTHGATAAAILDETTQQLTGIVVTNPGNDVPSDIKVQIASGNATKTFNCPFTVGASAQSGDFVKRGTGLLNLTMSSETPNTYEGSTVVEGGTLRFEYLSYPAASPLVLKGGEIQFGTSNDRTLASVEGYGTITCAGTVTISGAMRISCADLFGEKRSITAGSIAFAADAVLQITDPEKLASYTKAPRTAFLSATNITGMPTLALDAAYGAWSCTRSSDGKSLKFGPRWGLTLLCR